ncbi:MAG: type II secretion system protein [Candidatus Saccharimonadales bacterium]
MNRWQPGFTIIEVMIYLAISTLLLVSVSTLISGQQQKTEFNKSVKDVETAIQDVINDVDAGYFPESTDSVAGCTGSGGQGTRAACVFAGKVIQFGADGDKNKYNIYTIVGNRVTGSGKEVKNIAEATPRLIDLPTYTESKNLYADLEFAKVTVGSGDTAAFAVLPSFGKHLSATKASVVNNSGSAVLASLPGIPLPSSIASVKIATTSLNNTSINNASDGVKICVQEKGGGRKAVIMFGGKLGTAIQIKSEADIVPGDCA